MISLLIPLFGFLCLVRNVYGDNLICASACQSPFNYVLFAGDSAAAGKHGVQCHSLLRVQSTYVCMRSRCTQDEIQAGLKYFTKECGAAIYPWSVIDNITESAEASWHQITYEDLSSSGNTKVQVYKKPVLLSDSLYDLSWKTIATWDQAETDRRNYGYAMYAFWGGVVLIGILNRIYVLAMTWRNHDGADSQKRHNGIRGKLRMWTLKHITTPALFGYHCAHPFGYCTIPPRLQSWTIMAFLILNVVLCSVSYHAFANNLYFASKTTQIFRYLADRCGCLAIANMPLLWIFAMRNDVLIWLTGWSFTTYNQFHRWVARITTVEAAIHGVFYTALVFREGGSARYTKEWSERFWWMGVIAVCCMSLLCVFSIYPIRKHAYEFFLLFHITFAVLLMIAIFYHVKIFDGEYDGYIWSCVAVWSLDRLCRISRIVSLNFLGRKSIATFNPDANTVSLDVPVRSWLRPKPGSYYFVYLVHGIKPWESHPFTLSSWTIPSPPEPEANSDYGTPAKTTKPKNLNLSFIVRPHHSFTGRLRNLIIANNSRDQETAATSRTCGRIQSPVRVLVEGPYGSPHTHRLDRYKSVLFIIGGSGITVALAYFRALLDVLKQNQPIKLEQINLVWAVRDAAMFLEVFGDELGAFWRQQNSEVSSAVKLQIDLYISDSVATRYPSGTSSPLEISEVEDEKKAEADARGVTTSDSSSSSSSSSSSRNSSRASSHRNIATTAAAAVAAVADDVSEKLNDESGLPQHVNVICHRPRIHEIVAAEARAHATNGQKMAIVSCGPSRMADDIRAAVVSALAKGYEGITFYPEQFNW